MIRRWLHWVGVISLLGTALSGVAAAPPGVVTPLVRQLVVFDTGVANEAARSVLEAHGAVVQRQLDHTPFPAFSVLLPEQALPALGQARGVRVVETDYVVEAVDKPEGAAKKPSSPPPDEVLPWGVDRIDAELAWSSSKGTGVKVAIIDTGISKSHPDLKDNLKGGVNFVFQKGTVDPTKWDDDNGHGSHVAGTVAAVDNTEGVIGVAPEAHLYAVKVLDRRGSGYLSDVIDGIYWARNNGMQVINMSLGCDCPSDTLKQAVDDAYAAGVVVVAAAGNSGTSDGSGDTVIYPAKYDSVIAVAATDSSDTRAWWSSTGPAVELAAPGVDIYSTWKGTGYNTISGTSMASPHAAGTAALVLAAPVLAQFDLDENGSYSASEVRAALQATADDLGTAGVDSWYGYGLIDAEEAATGTP
ncbi:MAG: S8 family peptidase [Chloroflexi bacterium]|nr:S8 family peptidase [Chloroflexota bacterium]